MRRTLLLLVGLSAAAVVAIVLLVRHRQDAEQAAPQAKPPDGGRELDPSLVTLLRERVKSDRKHTSPFFAALSALARKQGLDPEELLQFVEEGYAVRTGGHVVAVLRGWTHSIPGSDSQHLLLLSDDGRLLDDVSCEINSRLTHMFVEHKGIFRTDAPAASADGAQLVIRYVPPKGESVSGNWSHAVTHTGKTHRFRWSEVLGRSQWDLPGLCRVAIRDGKFAILFPKL